MRLIIILALAFAVRVPADAAIARTALRDIAEQILGRGARAESVELLAGRIGVLGKRWGDEGLEVVRVHGQPGLTAMEQLGDSAPVLIRATRTFGIKAADILKDPVHLTLLARHGDDAATALARNPGIAGAAITSHGGTAAAALARLNGRSGRRLCDMIRDGSLDRGGKGQELLRVVRDHGEQAMDFIWRHKGVLAGGVALTAFLADPEPYLRGIATLAGATVTPLLMPLGIGAAVLLAFIAWFRFGLPAWWKARHRPCVSRPTPGAQP